MVWPRLELLAPDAAALSQYSMTVISSAVEGFCYARFKIALRDHSDTGRMTEAL